MSEVDPRRESVRNRFLREAVADREEGHLRPAEEYAARFPGFEELVREEHARLAGPATGATQASGGLAGAATAAPPLERVGPYRVLRELGRGGQGIVLLAEDERLGRRVAIKLLTGLASWSSVALERFRREAELAARLDHPGLCTVFEHGVEEGHAYVAMRYVEGESLASRLAGGPRPPAAWSLEVVEKVARALHAAHSLGVVHRDVKPGNIVLGAGDEPVVLDFGLARDLELESSLTRSGDLFGTLEYMSPEQAEGGRVDARTDVWALGVVLHELVSGRRPFGAPTRAGLFRAILEETAPDLRRTVPGISRDLAAVVATALEKEPDRRYASALALAEDVRAVRESRPVRARPTTLEVRVARWLRREPRLAALGGLLALALVSASGLAGYIVASAPALELGELELEQRARARLIGDVFGGLVRGEEGERRLRSFVEAAPDHANLRAVLAIHLARAEHLDEALEVLDAAPPGTDEPALIQRVRGALASGQWVSDDPEPPSTASEAYFAAALAMERAETAEQWAHVRRLAERAIYLSEAPPENYFHPLLRAANQQKDLETLALLEDTLVERWPDSPLSWFYVGMARTHADPAGAAEANERALELDPGFAQAWISLSLLRMFSGDFDGARDAFESGLALADSDAGRLKLLRLRASWLPAFGRLEESVATWDRALRLSPDDVGLLAGRAEALLALERGDEARRDLERVLELEPGHARATELLAD